MEYTVKKLCEMSGVSARTLRYYDKIGLLKPQMIAKNGYRIYGQAEVDLLQQILFYKELEFSLSEIKKIVASPEFDSCNALESHLIALLERKEQINLLIKNVGKTICSMKGENIMLDKEKFEGFKNKIILENEEKYGKEVRQRYGDDTVNLSNEKIHDMPLGQWNRQEELTEEIFSNLKKAMETGSVSCDHAQKACDLHRQWICMFWKDGMYSKEAHMGLGEMYVSDQRFKTYYDDRLGEGGAEFLRDALFVYTK